MGETLIMAPALKFVGSIRPHKGHICYQFNLATKHITRAVFEEPEATVNLNPALNQQMKRKKLIIQPNCIYCTALNLPNAMKRFIKMLQLHHATAQHHSQQQQAGQDGEHPQTNEHTEHSGLQAVAGSGE